MPINAITRTAAPTAMPMMAGSGNPDATGSAVDSEEEAGEKRLPPFEAVVVIACIVSASDVVGGAIVVVEVVGD